MEEVFETDPLYPSDSQVNYVMRSKAFYANTFPSVIILLYACINSFPLLGHTYCDYLYVAHSG